MGAVFSSASALLFRSLPVASPDRLMAAYEIRPDGAPTGVSLQTLEDWIEASPPSLSGLSAYQLRSFGYRAPETKDLQIVQVGMVTGGFFATLGAKIATGRDFEREEVVRHDHLIVLSHELRTRSFPPDESVLGRTIELNEMVYTVVGVLDREFEFLIQRGRAQTRGGGVVPDAYIPISYADYGRRRSVRTLGVIARLRDDAELETADSEIGLLAKRMAEAHPETSLGFGARLVAIHEAIHGPNRRPVIWTMAGAAALMLIALVNVTSLVVVRWMGDRRALATLQALGASTGSLFGKIFVECLLLCSAASALGIWIASVLLQIFQTLFPLLGGFEPHSVTIDHMTLFFTPGLAMTLAVILSLSALPILLSSWRDVVGTPRGTGPSTRRAHSFAITAQVCLSLVLLLVSGVLVRSLQLVLRQDPGFEIDHVTQFGIGLPASYGAGHRLIGFHREFSLALAEIPGVDSVAFSGIGTPLGGVGRRAFELENDPREPVDRPRAILNVVGPDYFQTLEIPLLAGRTMSWEEGPDKPRALLVSESFVHHYHLEDWRGRSLRMPWWDEVTTAGSLWEIVGIVADVRAESLAKPPEPTIYLSVAQVPSEGGRYLLRSSRTDPDFYAAIRNVKARLDSDLETLNPHPLSDNVSTSVATRRFSAQFATGIALTAFALCCVGIFGSVSTMLASQWREIGVRLVLGESYARARLRFIGRISRCVLTGMLAGIALYGLVSTALSQQLFGITPLDPAVIAGIFTLVCLASVAAAWLPLRRLQDRALVDILRHG